MGCTSSKKQLDSVSHAPRVVVSSVEPPPGLGYDWRDTHIKSGTSSSFTRSQSKPSIESSKSGRRKHSAGTNYDSEDEYDFWGSQYAKEQYPKLCAPLARSEHPKRRPSGGPYGEQAPDEPVINKARKLSSFFGEKKSRKRESVEHGVIQQYRHTPLPMWLRPDSDEEGDEVSPSHRRQERSNTKSSHSDDRSRRTDSDRQRPRRRRRPSKASSGGSSSRHEKESEWRPRPIKSGDTTDGDSERRRRPSKAENRQDENDRWRRRSKAESSERNRERQRRPSKAESKQGDNERWRRPSQEDNIRREKERQRRPSKAANAQGDDQRWRRPSQEDNTQNDVHKQRQRRPSKANVQRERSNSKHRRGEDTGVSQHPWGNQEYRSHFGPPPMPPMPPLPPRVPTAPRNTSSSSVISSRDNRNNDNKTDSLPMAKSRERVAAAIAALESKSYGSFKRDSHNENNNILSNLINKYKSPPTKPVTKTMSIHQHKQWPTMGENKFINGTHSNTQNSFMFGRWSTKRTGFKHKKSSPQPRQNHIGAASNMNMTASYCPDF